MKKIIFYSQWVVILIVCGLLSGACSKNTSTHPTGNGATNSPTNDQTTNDSAKNPNDPRVCGGDSVLDISFGNCGRVMTKITNKVGQFFPFNQGRDVAIQSDGKIVVAGYTGYVARHPSDVTEYKVRSRFVLIRYSPSGTLDPSFGDGGYVTTMIRNTEASAEANAVAIQSDGKIVVAGWVKDDYLNYDNYGAWDFAVVRYNTDGTLDETFGGKGIVTTDFGSRADSAKSLAIQADGKIIVGGNSGFDFALARYNSDGTLDTTFGVAGKVTTDWGGLDTSGAIAIQLDGKIVTTGYTFNGSNRRIAISRYNTDGSIDRTFGNGGKVTINMGGYYGFESSLAIQADGKIVVTGGFSPHGEQFDDFAVVRLNTDGTLDQTFGGSGIVTTDLGRSDDIAADVAIQSDGKIVVVGYSFINGIGSDPIFTLVRYNPDGSLDPIISNGGGKFAFPKIEHASAIAVAIQSDGKIVVVGNSFGDSGAHITVVRFNGQ